MLIEEIFELKGPGAPWSYMYSYNCFHDKTIMKIFEWIVI